MKFNLYLQQIKKQNEKQKLKKHLLKALKAFIKQQQFLQYQESITSNSSICIN